MNRYKELVCLILFVVLFLFAGVVNASEFTVENGVLKSYNGSGGEIVIPYDVTEIGQKVFEGNTSITKVFFPDAIKTIGVRAFANCENLKNSETYKEYFTVTFKVENGSWDDGTTGDITVTLPKLGNTVVLKLKAEQIPAVGKKPKEDFKEGSWNAVPDTDNAPSENMTYVYTYAAATTPGDMNNDGIVNLRDVLLLRNYFLKNGVGVKIYGNPDTSGDGQVNLRDVLLLRNYFLKNGVGVVIH